MLRGGADDVDSKAGTVKSKRTVSRGNTPATRARRQSGEDVDSKAGTSKARSKQNEDEVALAISSNGANVGPCK